MRSKTKEIFKELIDFYEASGRCRKQTIEHFKSKNIREALTRRRILNYEREGISILDKKITRKSPLIFPENIKKVLHLLKEDPSITSTEGGALLKMNPNTFSRHRQMLLNPEKLSTELKIQLGLIPSRPPSEETSEVEIKEEEVDDLSNSGFREVKSNRKWERCRHCLLCYIRLGRCEDKRSTGSIMIGCCANEDNPSTPQNDCDCELGENLSVIFALKNIFGLSSAQLSDFMKASNGRDPRDWYDLCEPCKVLLKEAIAIKHQVFQLSRKLENHKKKIMRKVEESILASSEDENGYDNHVMTKLIRESISSVAGNRGSVKVELEENGLTDPHQSNDPTDHHRHDNDNDSRMQKEDSDRGDASSSSCTHFLGDALGIGRVVDARTFLKLAKPKQTVCEMCGNKELRKHDLPMHYLLKHGVTMEGYKKLECPKEGCQYKTVYNQNFKNHLRLTHAQNSVACQFCGKNFTQLSQLKVHEEAHKNAETKPYQCEICGLGFAVKPYLRVHKRDVHEGYISPFRKRIRAERKSKKCLSFNNSTVISNTNSNAVTEFSGSASAPPLVAEELI